MNKKVVTYASLGEVSQTVLLDLMNDEKLRAHLVDHPKFTEETLKLWVMEKTRIDAADEYRVRAILVDGNIAGWCGIQPDAAGAELAIILSSSYWGSGIQVFRDMMLWAQELGHQEVVFHLLETRRKYRALEKMAKEVKESEWMERKFRTYILSTDTSG